jgi:hypothetical protein
MIDSMTFKCRKCGEEITIADDIIKRINDLPATDCPECGEVRRGRQEISDEEWDNNIWMEVTGNDPWPMYVKQRRRSICVECISIVDSPSASGYLCNAKKKRDWVSGRTTSLADCNERNKDGMCGYFIPCCVR